MDKRIRAFVIILFFWWIPSKAQQPQELFLQANKAYENGKFSEALNQYHAIKKKGPILWYNMGNCYYRQEDFARALACWHRARKGATASLYKDIDHNCAHAYQKLSKKYDQPVWNLLMASSAYQIPLIIVQLLFLLCWVVLLVMLYQWPKSIMTYAGIMGLLVITSYCGLILWYHYQQQKAYGIIVEKKAPLYVGPDTNYHAIGTIELGDKVALMQKRATWYKVSKDGITGWIPCSTIEIIEQLS